MKTIIAAVAFSLSLTAFSLRSGAQSIVNDTLKNSKTAVNDTLERARTPLNERFQKVPSVVNDSIKKPLQAKTFKPSPKKSIHLCSAISRTWADLQSKILETSHRLWWICRINLYFWLE